MLKIAEVGRRRTNSISILDHHDGLPPTPAPTPCSSFVPSSLLDQYEARLIKVAAQLLEPRKPSPDTIQDKKKIDEIEKICHDFYLNDDQLREVEQRMVLEVNWGLGKSTNSISNIKSYITYVSQLPTGREHGTFLALDLGGTNFRAILIELEAGTSSIKMKAAKHPVSQDLMQGPGEDLFNFMVDKLREFMIEHQLLNSQNRYRLGFTFSFPTVQHGLNSADLANWTKGYVCSGVEGVDVGKLLNASIARYKDMNIEVCAILNDTTGCLLACAYKRPDCAIGVIIGTGTNASYVEDISNVELYEGNPGRHRQVVINTEWGGLGNTGNLDIIRTRFDHSVDKNSKNPQKQVYEKLISGMYLGELTRYILLEASQKKLIFSGTKTSILQEKEVFQTRHISAIESDEPDEYTQMNEVLEELGLIEGATELDRQIIRYICECVSTRAAVLAAAGVAALLNKMDRKRVTVGMDGSLYKFHPHFHNRMVAKIAHLVDPSIQFNMVLSEDGSGRGAGLAAAVSHR